MNEISIAGRRIGAGHPVFVVAEMSANHSQSFETAVEIIHAAKKAGADAVKLQTYTPDTLTLDSDQDCFHVGEGSPWEGRTLHELYGEAFTPWEWQPDLMEIATNLGLVLFSTPFDETAVAFLEEMNVPAHKIASFELVDLPLIRRVATTEKPIIMSTGMATLDEIAEAVATAREAGGRQIALLRCCSAYPAPPAEMNLRTIRHLEETFSVPVGLSDHTLGIAVPVTAVALGASIVEKHITLSRTQEGPDSAFSLEPHEFAAMINAIRTAEQALGRIRYGTTASEASSRDFRRSLFAVQNIVAGQRFTPSNVRSIRPASGLPPRDLPNILGRRAARDISTGTPLSWVLIQDEVTDSTPEGPPRSSSSSKSKE